MKSKLIPLIAASTFKEFPQRQKAASFNLDYVVRQLQEGHRSK